MLLVMAWIMFSMNWQLALLSMVAVPLLVLTHKWSQKTLTPQVGGREGGRHGPPDGDPASIASLWLTQAFGRERDEYGRFQGAVGGTVRLMLRVHWREVIYTLAVTTILGLGTALILGYGGYLVYRDQVLPGGSARPG